MKKNVFIASALALFLLLIPLASHVAGNGQDFYATNIPIGTTAADFEGLTVTHKGAALNSDEKVATGDIITKDGIEYIAVVLGDVNGDATINSTDFMQVRKAFLGTFSLNNAAAKAADVNGDGKINSTDFMQIRKHFLGTYTIVPKGEIEFGAPVSEPPVSSNESVSSAPEASSQPNSSKPESSEANSTLSIIIGPGEDESGWGPIF